MKSQYAWWKGEHGEWYVVGQIVLIVLVFFGPRNGLGLPLWTSPYSEIGTLSGSVLFISGVFLFLAGIFKHGVNITPLPFPKENMELIETGPYRFVRHPMYGGGVMLAFGWAFWCNGWLTIGYCVILFIYLDIKASREEKWLNAKFSNYTGYQKRVCKLIPFIY
jgi:protein-S-isoprenylcysteine O-methyltransferase Ste14